MRAMILDAPRQPLHLTDLPIPPPGDGQVLLRVHACGICRTDLHIRDGELADPKLPLIPGHQIVGTITGRGPGATRLAEGERVGVPWLGGTAGTCTRCVAGHATICDTASSTGYQINGGYAEWA